MHARQQLVERERLGDVVVVGGAIRSCPMTVDQRQKKGVADSGARSGVAGGLEVQRHVDSREARRCDRRWREPCRTVRSIFVRLLVAGGDVRVEQVV